MDYSIRIPAIVCRTVHIMCNFNHFIDFALFHDSGTCFFMHFECFSFFSLVIMAKKNLLFRHSAKASIKNALREVLRTFPFLFSFFQAGFQAGIAQLQPHAEAFFHILPRQMIEEAV